MTRITKQDREDIIIKAVRNTFKEAGERLEVGRTKLADDLYQHAFGVNEAVARKLGPQWVNFVREITIDCDGFEGYYYGTKNGMQCRDIKMSADRPMPANVGDSFRIHQDHPLKAQADGW